MAEMVGSAVVQDGVSRVVSFVLGKLEEKASKGHIIERLEMAHTELELALERSSKLPITDRSLLRRRKILKRAYEECGNVLDRCKLPALEDQENEQGVTRFSFPRRIAGLGRPSRNKGLLGYSDVGRFERYAAWADKFMRDLESGYSLRQYMFSNPLIRRLLQGTALEYRMVQGSQVQSLCILPMNFAELGVVACLRFMITDLKMPEKRFRFGVGSVLRLSESTNILGITIKCLQSLLLMPQIKSAVEAAMGELAQLPTQDIFDTYASSWSLSNPDVHLWRPNPECCKADGHGTSTLPYRLPEEVMLLLFSCPVTPYGCNLHSSPEKADKDMVKDRLPLRLGVILAPHEMRRNQDLQEGDVAVEWIEGTEEERIVHRNVSLHQVEEMVLPKAIDCFHHRPEVTRYSVSWRRSGGSNRKTTTYASPTPVSLGWATREATPNPPRAPASNPLAGRRRCCSGTGGGPPSTLPRLPSSFPPSLPPLLVSLWFAPPPRPSSR